MSNGQDVGTNPVASNSYKEAYRLQLHGRRRTKYFICMHVYNTETRRDLCAPANI